MGQIKIVCCKTNPPLGGILTAEYVSQLKNVPLNIQWGDETSINGTPCRTAVDLSRTVAKFYCSELYEFPAAIAMTEIDHWLNFSLGPLNTSTDFGNTLNVLDRCLGPVTYLANKRLSIADFCVFSVIYANEKWHDLVRKNLVPVNVLRWYSFMESQMAVSKVIQSLPADIKTVIVAQASSNRQSMDRIVDKSTTASGRAREGKFVDLPGAEMGKVVVRFPPEASGYLHIGHAKAALLNQYYQEAFKGKLIMRFDDTNPAKENLHFEKVILEDVALLDIKPDLFTHTSQYFDLMLEYCEKLLKEGKAYVDDTEAELMKQQREQKVESANRSNSVEKNMELWKDMIKGTAKGQTCCVRAKIDMQSPNGCLRDPTIYRCKNEPHPRTGDKYKVYPTYDFACPIVDAIEGVTHTLRTMEYHDRDPQFYWFIDALGLRKPYIWEYSRLSMTNTVLSKRKLTWFVNEKLVDGWDDPRMPTVRGVLRRGMTVEGLKEFIIAQGSSRSVVFMEWDKIWAFNKKVIDPIAPRYTSLDYADPVTILVKGAKEELLTVPKHPKNPDVGNKELWVSPKILVDRLDAESLKEGENATFINWGNLLIKKINRENGKITTVEAELNLENKDYKKTLKLTWLADTQKTKFTPTWCVYFEHIISKPLLGKDEDFKQFIGHETRKEVQMLGDPELKKLKKGDIIELQRRGFFKVDVAYQPISLYTCKEQSVVLFYIPDGRSTKENAVASVAKKATTPQKNSPAASAKTALEINADIIKQGDVVRNLKAQKAPKSAVDIAVKALLALKADYKVLTNADWKPDSFPPTISGAPENVLKASSPKTKSAGEINSDIIKQGDIVRDLKAQKASKADVDVAVKALLALKADYKALTNVDWKPGCVPPSISCPAENCSKIAAQGDTTKTGSPAAVKTAIEINSDIIKQGDVVRNLKAQKASKSDVDVAVKALLALKADYKALTNSEWKPGCVPPTTSGSTENNSRTAAQGDTTKTGSLNTKSPVEINSEIIKQGDIVRDLKAQKASKTDVDAAVKALLALKADYKALTNVDWKPGCVPHTKSDVPPQNSDLNSKITAQADKVRNLKTAKADKATIDAEVKMLLALKDEYKQLTGTDFPVAGGRAAKPAATPKEKVNKQKPAVKEKRPIDVDDGGLKKQTRLGLEAKKEDNLSDWYSQVITKGEMIEYYPVSGCYIFRPWSFSIWEAIKDWFDIEMKKLGVQNCYFPIFVSKSVLEKEKTHIADFAPEVAWVTKSGDSDMAEPIAVRPTSETVMYPAYAKWIQSYRDLPIKLNQWNNVVRWEFKHPQPFLRTREFLWQEGHTAYALKEEADVEVKTILDLYARIYTDLLAIPVVKGRKTEKEKFAGGDYTLTVEAFVSASGRAIQGATSHHLGQNFSKMFDIIYEDPETQEKKYVFQNSWGITTRTIGVMIMVHADNQGLVLPPKVANIQIVIVPCGITVGLSEEARAALQTSCDQLEKALKQANVRVEGDYRSNYSPGWKFNHWELKGVPIRVELGPKDIDKKQIVAVRRDTGEKLTIPRQNAVEKLVELLENIQGNLYKKACDDLNSHKILLTDWAQFSVNLDKKNMILAPFCGDMVCEDKIKADSARDDGEAVEPGAPSMGAKSLCIPLEQPAPIKPSDKCIHPDCQNKPKFYTLFGRSY